jgi:hypothetical protein
VDPVTLGLCTQLELDLAVSRVAQRRERQMQQAIKRGETLQPLQDSVPAATDEPPADSDNENE